MFVNKIYLYDDKMTVLCNTQDGHFDVDLKEVSSLKDQLVEAGGVEPPSENIPRKASTGLGQEQISPPCSPLTGHRAAIPPVQISWKLPAGAKLHQPDAMSPAGRIRRRPV